jgi:hypothetical protein
MSNSFEELMSKKSDEQLLKIVAGRPEDYQPEALAAAQNEAIKRKLAYAQFAAVKNKAVKEKAYEAMRAKRPLETESKIGALLFPLSGVMGGSSLLRVNGYHRKADELTRWRLYGIALYITIFILFLLFT